MHTVWFKSLAAHQHFYINIAVTQDFNVCRDMYVCTHARTHIHMYARTHAHYYYIQELQVGEFRSYQSGGMLD